MKESDLKKLVSEWRDTIKTTDSTMRAAVLGDCVGQIQRLMSADDWTQKPPKEPGIYFFAPNDPRGRDAVQITYVISVDDVGISICRRHGEYEDRRFLPGEKGWWKPLHVPELPKT